MNFDMPANASTQISNSNSNSNLGQTFLSSLIDKIGDDVISSGSNYLEQQLDQWSQNAHL